MAPLRPGAEHGLLHHRVKVIPPGEARVILPGSAAANRLSSQFFDLRKPAPAGTRLSLGGSIVSFAGRHWRRGQSRRYDEGSRSGRDRSSLTSIWSRPDLPRTAPRGAANVD